jgi:hypothetical protein
LSAEKAAKGETWLSSQNRNFKNRMGKGALRETRQQRISRLCKADFYSAGSFGNVTSAIVCAASSFSMSVIDPAPFLKDLDVAFFWKYKNAPALTSYSPTPVKYVEPHVGSQASLT